MRIAIAHDYLLQYGGAERVVAAWSSVSPAAPIYALAYAPEGTYDLFRDRDVRVGIDHRLLRDRLELLLPLLPSISKRMTVEDGDAAIVSTSGWAHQFSYEMPTLAYVHSPARWLYAGADYLKPLSRVKRGGLRVSRAHLRSMDRRGMKRMTAVVANSAVSQSRIREAYGIQAEVVHPPVVAVSSGSRPPSVHLPDRYAVVVSRARGYKNIDLAIEATILAGLSCVVVGAGSAGLATNGGEVVGLGRVHDDVLRYVYQHASVIVGSAHEDFGLTVIEANLEGTPSAAIPFGGYLETVSPGESGVLATEESTAALAIAIRSAAGIDRDSVRSWASNFSLAAHVARIGDAVRSLG